MHGNVKKGIILRLCDRKRDKVKICYIISHLDYGGAERVVFDLSKCLSLRNFDVFIIPFRKARNKQSETKFKKELLESKTHVVDLKYSNNDFVRFLSLLKTLVKLKPEVIHTHTEIPDFYGGIASLFFPKIRFIRTLHNTYMWSGHYLLGKITEFVLKYRSNKVIACSEDVFYYGLESLSIPYEKLILIHNGIDSKKFTFKPFPYLKSNDGKITTAVIGRFTRQKGHDIFLKALTKISLDILKEINVLFLGDGELRGHIEQFIKDNNLCNVVNLKGFVNIKDYLDKVDIVCIPSRHEGAPIVALEAMLSGKLLITSDVPGLKRLILDNEIGLTFPRDDYEELALLLKKVIANLGSNHKKYLEIVENAKRNVLNNFKLEQMYSKYEKLYLDIKK